MCRKRINKSVTTLTLKLTPDPGLSFPGKAVAGNAAVAALVTRQSPPLNLGHLIDKKKSNHDMDLWGCERTVMTTGEENKISLTEKVVKTEKQNKTERKIIDLRSYSPSPVRCYRECILYFSTFIIYI